MKTTVTSRTRATLLRVPIGDVAPLVMASVLLAAVQACGPTRPFESDRDNATSPAEFERRNPLLCVLDSSTNEPYGLERTVEPHEQRDDRIRVTYTWRNDCPSTITLHDVSVQVWDNPDRTGQSIGASSLDDIDIGPNVDAEVRNTVLLDDGYGAIDIEGPENVVMNFNVRYADQ